MWICHDKSLFRWSLLFVLSSKSASIMFLLSPHNGMIVHSGMVFGARKEKKKKENETPSILPLLPFTNHYWSNFVTPPADLNCSVAGANGMWVVWSFCKEEDSGSDEASGRDEAFAVPVNADSNLMCAPPQLVWWPPILIMSSYLIWCRI